MCDNNQQAITMIRGTTVSFGLVINDEDGNEYTLESGELLRFGVKASPASSEYILSKDFTAQDEEGNYTFGLDPSDTASLGFGQYWYDIGLQSGNAYYNIIPASPFNLAYNVTAWEV